MPHLDSTTTPPGGLAALRTHLALASEARRSGDHAAADAHEYDALIALRAALAVTKGGEARA
jgi:hypothetical protein